MEAERRRFYGPEKVFRDVEAQVRTVEEAGGVIDHLTFVPDGEPTLDLDLGKEIEKVKDLGYPVAVITNSSLMGDEVVREEISEADLVSVKVDSAEEGTWRKINRPHGGLSLERIEEGLKEFSRTFKGPLITETMLVRDVNDGPEMIEATARLIRDMDPRIAYISAPIRPPAEEYVGIPTDGTVLNAVREFASHGLRVVPLTEKEYGDFTYTGDIRSDILAITSVHPMREDSVKEMLQKAQVDWTFIERLIGSGELTTEMHNDIRYYRRYFRT